MNLAIEGVNFGNVLVRAVPPQLAVRLQDEAGQALDAPSEVFVTDELVSGQTVKRSLGTPAAVSGHWLRHHGLLEAEGCHKLTVHMPYGGGAVTSNTITVDVQAPRFVDGGLIVGGDVNRVVPYAWALHDGVGSRQMLAGPQLIEPSLARMFPIAKELPRAAVQPMMPGGDLGPLLRLSWEIVWRAGHTIVASSFNPLIQDEVVDLAGNVTVLLGAFRTPTLHLRVAAVVERANGEQALSLIEVKPHNEGAPRARVLWTSSIPASAGRVVSGTAMLDPSRPPLRVVLSGVGADAQPDNTVLSHATCTVEAPPSGWDAQSIGPSMNTLRPVLAVAGEPRVGVLVEGGHPSVWSSVVWSPVSGDVNRVALAPDDIVAAEALFVPSAAVDAPPQLWAAVRRASDEVEMLAGDRRVSLGQWAAGEPLRLATDGSGVLMLRANEAHGPELFRVNP